MKIKIDEEHVQIIEISDDPNSELFTEHIY